MTKVLEIFGEPINTGGQQSFVLYTLQNMDFSDMVVDIFTPYYADNTRLIGLIEEHNGKVYAAGLPFVPGANRSNIYQPLFDYLKTNRYDVAHIHSGSITALAYCAKVASKAGIKRVIVHSHSSGINDNIKHKLIRAYASPMLKKYATDYCACSVGAAEWKFPESVIPKTRIINNGIDTEYFAYNPQIRDRMRKEYNIDKDTLVIGHVGRFTYEKNQTFLVDVLNQYRKKNSKMQVRLVLLGEGDQKEPVKQKASDLGLKEDIIFPTAYDQARDYLQMFDVFAFPSLFEGLGIAGIEAQAAGLPVIASTGVPETMKLTDYVKYISLNNIDAWCEALDSFRGTERKDTRNQIKEKGFDIKDTAKEVQKLYDIDINER